MKAHVKNGSDAAYNQEAHTLLALSVTRESNTVQEPVRKDHILIWKMVDCIMNILQLH